MIKEKETLSHIKQYPSLSVYHIVQILQIEKSGYTLIYSYTQAQNMDFCKCMLCEETGIHIIF